MTKFKAHRWHSLTVLLLVFTALIGDQTSHAAAVRAPESEKVLEIERYKYEPMQLVDLKIGTQSVKDRIVPRFRDERSKIGLDRVSFTEADDWFTRVSLTLRNVSEKPVYGVRAYLVLKFEGQSLRYGMSLMSARLLRNDPLQPGGEIELTIVPRELEALSGNLKSAGLNGSPSEVTLLFDAVNFSEVLQWSRGSLLRPDSTVFGKWVPVDRP